MPGSSARKSRAGNQKHLDRNREWSRNNRERANASRRAAYARNKAECPEALVTNRRAEKLKQRYGLTPEQHVKLFEEQHFRCAICSTDTPGSKVGWHTDHDHLTGNVRGILCHKCNVLLGNARDDEETLLSAAAYLKRSREGAAS